MALRVQLFIAVGCEVSSGVICHEDANGDICIAKPESSAEKVRAKCFLRRARARASAIRGTECEQGRRAWVSDRKDI